jgi:hypothetical protein
MLINLFGRDVIIIIFGLVAVINLLRYLNINVWRFYYIDNDELDVIIYIRYHWRG